LFVVVYFCVDYEEFSSGQIYQSGLLQRVSIIIGKSLRPAYNILTVLEELEIVQEITGGQRGKLYMFTDYVALFKS